MAEVTSTHSHLSGRLKVNSLTLNVAGESAATAPNAGAISTVAHRSDLIECIVLLLVERPANVKRATRGRIRSLSAKLQENHVARSRQICECASSSCANLGASPNCASLRWSDEQSSPA